MQNEFLAVTTRSGQRAAKGLTDYVSRQPLGRDTVNRPGRFPSISRAISTLSRLLVFLVVAELLVACSATGEDESAPSTSAEATTTTTSPASPSSASSVAAWDFGITSTELEARALTLWDIAGWEVITDTDSTRPMQTRVARGSDGAIYAYRLSEATALRKVVSVAVEYPVEISDDGSSLSFDGGPPVFAAALAAPDTDSATEWINAVGENLLPNMAFDGPRPAEFNVDGYVSVTGRVSYAESSLLLVFRPFGAPEVDLDPYESIGNFEFEEDVEVVETQPSVTSTTLASTTTDVVTTEPSTTQTSSSTTIVVRISRPGVLTVGRDIEPGVYRTESITGFCLVRALTSYSGDFREQWGFEEGGIGVVEILDTDLAFENERDCGTWVRVE